MLDEAGDSGALSARLLTAIELYHYVECVVAFMLAGQRNLTIEVIYTFFTQIPPCLNH